MFYSKAKRRKPCISESSYWFIEFLSMFRILFHFSSFSYWCLVIWYDLNSKKRLLSRSPVSGLIQKMYTLCWQGSTWKPTFLLCLKSSSPTSVTPSLLYLQTVFCFASFPSLYQCAQVCPIETNKWTTLCECYTPPRYSSFILFSFRVLWRTILLIVFPTPPFFLQPIDIWFLIVLLLWNHPR